MKLLLEYVSHKTKEEEVAEIEVKIACGYRGSLRPCVVDW